MRCSMRCMTKRLSITLEAEDERAVESFAKTETRDHEALLTWAAQRGLEVTGSTAEAALLRLLLRAGVEFLRTSALDVAYAELAVSMTEAERADSRAARDRYVKRTERTRAR